MREERINEMWAILLLAISVIAMVSLLSFDPADLPFYTSNPNRPVNNFTGIAGAYFSGILMFAVGKAGFVFPLITLLWAVGRFTGRVIKKFYLKLLGAIVLVIAVSSFLSMINQYDSTIRFTSGGVVGLGFSSLLAKYFGAVGAYVIISALSVLSLLLATEFLLFPLLFAAFKRSKALFVKAGSSLRSLDIKKALPKPRPKTVKLEIKTQAEINAARQAFRKPNVEINKPAPAVLSLKKKAEPKPAHKEEVAAKAARKEPKERESVIESVMRTEKKEYT